MLENPVGTVITVVPPPKRGILEVKLSSSDKLERMMPHWFSAKKHFQQECDSLGWWLAYKVLGVLELIPVLGRIIFLTAKVAESMFDSKPLNVKELLVENKEQKRDIDPVREEDSKPLVFESTILVSSAVIGSGFGIIATGALFGHLIDMNSWNIGIGMMLGTAMVSAIVGKEISSAQGDKFDSQIEMAAISGALGGLVTFTSSGVLSSFANTFIGDNAASFAFVGTPIFIGSCIAGMAAHSLNVLTSKSSKYVLKSEEIPAVMSNQEFLGDFVRRPLSFLFFSHTRVKNLF